MIVEITVPDLGESISEVEIGEWLIDIGDRIAVDDEVVALESDKATVEVPAPDGGVLVKILKKQGETATIGEAIGHIDTEKEDDEVAEYSPPAEAEKGAKKRQPAAAENEEDESGQQEEHGAAGEKIEKTPPNAGEQLKASSVAPEARIMPSAARVLAQHDIAPEEVTPTGPGGRILKEDAERAVKERNDATEESGEKRHRPKLQKKEQEKKQGAERRESMTPIRRTIAARLLDAKQNMALLTTFNEADMTEVKKARAEYGKEFQQKHGIKLGFMSFFVKAAVSALLDFPLVNARIDDSDIVYHNNCDIGVAIGGGKGLVVPVIRRAERLGFAEIEKKIADFAQRAEDNSLTIDELQGGTFTISNGGIYGSMLSTPIVNPPQSAILGLHAIKDRPVAVAGEILIRPIMYLALTYDHRIIDGREAVSFLKTIKNRIERPQKLLLEI